MSYFKNLEEEQNRLNLKSEKVELAAKDLPSFLKDAKTIEKKFDSITNTASYLSHLYDKIEQAADKVGVDLPSEALKYSKLVKKLEKIKL